MPIALVQACTDSAPRRVSLWSPSVAVLLGCTLVMALTADNAVAVWSTGIFVNPDDAMRAVEVRDFLSGQGWFDLIQHRMAPGHGVPMHWSRLADLPIAGLIVVFRGALGPETAERVARLLEPILLLVGFMACQARIGRLLLGERGPLAACLLAAGGAETVGVFIPGHIHHHGLQVLLLMVMTLATLEGLGDSRRRDGLFAVAGAVASLTLAINLQNLPFVVVVIAVPCIAWLLNPRAFRFALRAFAASLLAGSTLVFLVQVPLERWTLGTCDAFGAPHLLAIALGAAGLLVLAATSSRLATPLSRAVGLVGLGAMVVSALHATYPACLGDPYSGLDPFLRSRWLAEVSEAMPLAELMRRDLAGTMPVALALGIGLVSIAVAIVQGLGLTRARWAVVAGFAGAGVAGTLWEIRVAASAEPLAALGAAWLLSRIFDPARPRRALAAPLCVFCGLMTTQAGWGTALSVRPGRGSPAIAGARIDTMACDMPSAYHGLAGLPAGTVLSTIDPGSQILAYTHHSVLAAPYHRNADGNLASLRFFDASPVEALVIARATDTRYVVLCLTSPEVVDDAQRRPDGVAALVLRNDPPEWLRPTGADAGPVRVYELRR